MMGLPYWAYVFYDIPAYAYMLVFVSQDPQ